MTPEKIRALAESHIKSNRWLLHTPGVVMRTYAAAVRKFAEVLIAAEEAPALRTIIHCRVCQKDGPDGPNKDGVCSACYGAMCCDADCAEVGQ